MIKNQDTGLLDLDIERQHSIEKRELWCHHICENKVPQFLGKCC